MPDYADKGLEFRFVLPFATLAANRLKDFTKDMEMATILFLAESNREKDESHILKKQGEKIVFITEAYYPIWLIPYNGATLVFDGLGIASHTCSYDSMPNFQIFDKNIRENQETIATYTATLATSKDYFGNFRGKEENTIKGLIAAPDLIRDFMIYLPQIKEAGKPFTNKAVLTHTIDYHETQTGAEQLSNLRKRISKDIEDVDAGIRLLNAATLERIKAIREEIRKTREEYDRQVDEIKPRVAGKILLVQNKCHRKITRTSKRFRDELQRLRKKQVKLQKTMRHLKAEAKRCETKIQSKKLKKRKQTTSRWTLKLKRIKKKLPTVNKEITRTNKKIQNVEAARKLELTQLQTECDERIEAAEQPFRDIQASKEAENTIKRQDIETLGDMTSRITSQMRKIGETKKVSLAEFDKLLMPRRRETYALVYVPFYLVRYEKEDKERYVVFPPSFASSLGVLTRMKGTLGAAKMKSLLQPHSKAITAFLNQLVAQITEDPVLEKEVTEAGIQNSILLSKQLRIGVKKGLGELERENWMSKDELQTCSKLLYMYA